MSRSFRLKPPLPAGRERDIVNACLDLLRVRQYYPVRLQSGLFKTPDDRFVRIGEPGLPDYVAVHELYPAVFVEFKRRGGKPRPEQIEKIQILRDVLRLAVAVVDDPAALAEFLTTHEHRSNNA
jgi:hypothetical protein